jgi:hypothetical protein
MSERLDYIRKHFEEQEKIKVEVPVFISETSKGNVHYYFTGRRCGYDFKHGIAWVDRKDIHHFEGQQHYIIHNGKEDK